MHEDNQALVVELMHLTSRSPAMMDKLRKLWELINTTNINIHLIGFYVGPHSIDMFATHGNSQLPRYNSRWRDPTPKPWIPSIFPTTFGRRRPTSAWTLLPDIVQKLPQFGAEATIIAPYWPANQWYQLLSKLSDEQIVYPPPEIYSFQARAERTRASDRHS
jgi:hypothetical protein